VAEGAWGQMLTHADGQPLLHVAQQIGISLRQA
jgi:hypothetical protein